MNYYNENDVKAAAWLRQLIVARLIPEGEIDERSIQEVSAGDLEGFTQCHFFAGIGGWSYALQLAGWPDSREVWTGSCPCQPLSCAGQRKGHADERHLWPAFYALINKRKPSIVFGEQVASKDGREWFAGVRADLEGIGYAVGGSDLCAASVGSPHKRQRLYWLADNECARREGLFRSENMELQGREESLRSASESGAISIMAESDGGNESYRELQECDSRPRQSSAWSRFEIVQCRDGKARRFEPESFPLADGIPGRVALLRGYGNAIVPQVAAEFIKAASEVIK